MSGPVDGAPPPSLGGPVERRRQHWWQRDHLVDDKPVVDDESVARDSDDERAEADERHDVVEYDLTDWRKDQVAALVEQLEAEHLAHEWRGSHLLVPGAREAKVDELIDLFDALPDDDAVDDVEYVFEQWTPQQCQQLVERLLALDIACVWDGYLLSVGEADEAAVDAEVLAIDPTFPVSDPEVIDGDEEEPPTDAPSGPGWGRVIAEIADGLIGGIP